MDSTPLTRVGWSRCLVGALTLFLALSPAEACTGIRLKAADGTFVHARTLEFATNLKSDVIVVPRGFARVGTTPDGKPGMKWNAKYASVGANGVGLPYIFDGVNEKGLAAGLFYFPTSAGYNAYASTDAPNTMAPWQLGSWILENFASVDELKSNINKVVVPAVVFEAWGIAPEVHYAVQDASGQSVVIEYVGGKLQWHDNPLGVITNSPTFDWHMTNLRNYLNFSVTNAPPVKLGTVTLAPFGQGSGMLGMPGDFTPPSRFVRAVAFTQSAFPVKTNDEVVLQAFHILNNFDIPQGSTREQGTDSHGNEMTDYTQWTSAKDLKAKRFYFRTFHDSQIRMVDLTKFNLDAKEIATVSMQGEEPISNLSPQK
ncbi:MAG: choloylglycine hydrolase family protein [Cyanobacteria bacterium SZAS-4]|nr:choloylglycine hydrolase family protein [Cyanobacteria bacterium SZAS-4]